MEEPHGWHPLAKEKYKIKYDSIFRDELTGLHNRRYLNNELSKISPTDNVSVVMLDIDDFKSFNDKHGHDIGDLVLRAVGRELVGSIREEDIAARYGGEEFTLIFKNFNNKTDIQNRVEEIRKKFENTVIGRNDKKLKFTASFGIAFSDGTKKIDEFLKLADKALYTSKHGGKNQITVAQSV